METLKDALISVMVSCLISGIGLYYLRGYYDRKQQEREELADQRRNERRKADMLEARRRRAAGRMFFWMHYALIKGVEQANGDLEKAFLDYNEIDEDQKAFEQELLAEHQDENRGGGV